MVDFVDLMEGRSIGLEENDPEMEKYWYGENWILEPTCQAKRFQCLISDQIRFQGKKLHYKNPYLHRKIPHIISDIKSLSLPPETLLDGYLSFDNDDSTTLYRFLSLKSMLNVQDMYVHFGLIKFYITDLIFFDKQEIFSLPLFDRKKQLGKIIVEKENVKLQKTYISKKLEMYNSLKDEFKMFIFKNIESVYKFGVSSNWLIFKMPTSYYMIIIGFIENDKEEFRHMVLALEGAQFKNGKIEKIMNVPVHGTDNRLVLFQKKDELKDKVFEIKALEKKSGKYQEARFFCLREDLKLEDCIYTEEEE